MKLLLLSLSFVVFVVSATLAQTGDTVSTIYVRQMQTYTECGLRKMDWVYVTYTPKRTFLRGVCGFHLQPPSLRTVTNYAFLDYEKTLFSGGSSLGFGMGKHWLRRKLMLEVGYQKSFAEGRNEIGLSLHKTVLFRSVHDGRVKLPLVRLGTKLGWLYGEEDRAPMVEMQLSVPTFMNWLILYGAYGIEIREEILPQTTGTFRVGLKYHVYGSSGARILKSYRYRWFSRRF